MRVDVVDDVIRTRFMEELKFKTRFREKLRS